MLDKRTKVALNEDSPALLSRQKTLGPGTKEEEFIRKLYEIAETEGGKGFAANFSEDGYMWDPNDGTKYYGADIAASVDSGLAAFPDLHREILSIWSSGDVVFVEMSFNGTHTGDMKTPSGVIPMTGKVIKVPTLDVFKVRDNKVVEFHCYSVGLQILRQLGKL
jgi:predicted ester cyclase